MVNAAVARQYHHIDEGASALRPVCPSSSWTGRTSMGRPENSFQYGPAPGQQTLHDYLVMFPGLRQGHVGRRKSAVKRRHCLKDPCSLPYNNRDGRM